MMILTLLTDESHGKQKWNNSIAQAVDTMMPLNLWLLTELNICFRKAFFPGRFFIVVTTPLTDLTILTLPVLYWNKNCGWWVFSDRRLAVG